MSRGRGSRSTAVRRALHAYAARRSSVDPAGVLLAFLGRSSVVVEGRVLFLLE